MSNVGLVLATDFDRRDGDLDFHHLGGVLWTQVSRLTASGCEECVVVGAPDGVVQTAVRGQLGETPVRFAHLRSGDAGLSSTLRRGLQVVMQQHLAAAVVAVQVDGILPSTNHCRDLLHSVVYHGFDAAVTLVGDMANGGGPVNHPLAFSKTFVSRFWDLTCKANPSQVLEALPKSRRSEHPWQQELAQPLLAQSVGCVHDVSCS
ncbi:MAG: NTP transferase domain-containing protein [Planctomycetota bacterium]